MEDYRSKSYREGMMQIQNYYGGGGGRPTSSYAYTTSSYGSRDIRSYSASYAPQTQTQTQYQTQMGMGMGNKDVKLKKGGSKDGGSSSSSSKIWNDPEFQRKKRVASYKMYSVEGKMKGSLRRSLRWLKDRYTQVVYGWW